MDDQKDKQEGSLKNIPIPERKISASEQAVNFDSKKEVKAETNVEKKESLQEDKIISEELRREIELMQLDENLKKEAEQKSNKVQFLADDDKLKELIRIAKDKGVIYAIQVCKKMNDPFLLDTLHDILAKEGYYKNFIKK
jgi:negative regulator of genetic competence, sporulation and motility